MTTTTPATPADPTCERCRQPKSEHTPATLLDPVSGHLDIDALECPGHWGRSTCFRRAAADMPCAGVAPHPDVPLGRYRHHKGDIYFVTGGALLAMGEADTVLVVYRPVFGRQDYQSVLTVDDFTATIKVDGETVRRFEFLG